MDNHEFVARILDIYDSFIRERIKFADQTLEIYRNDCKKKYQKRSELVWILSYALTTVMKFLAIVIGGSDSGSIAFDTYSSFKANRAESKTGDSPAAKYFIKIQDAYRHLLELVAEVRTHIDKNGPDTFVTSFFAHRHENSKLWTLLKTCRDLGFQPGSYTEYIGNSEQSRDSALSTQMNALLSEYHKSAGIPG